MEKEFKVNNFDLLRILAATQVVLRHSLTHFNIPCPEWGALLDAFPGVPIFFVISGFLISASFERTSSLSAYFRNRVLRIYPALWCCVILTIVAAACLGFGFLNRHALIWLPSQLIGLIYTPQFLKGFGCGSYNGSLWTIPIELQFYLLLPILYWRGREAKHRTLWIGAAWLGFVASGLLYAWTLPPPAEGVNETLLRKLIGYSFAPHIYLFLSGVLLQRCHAQRSAWISGKGLYWLVAYLAFYFTAPHNAATSVAGTLLMGVVVIAVAFTVPKLSRWLLRGNDISYGVYIYHGLILNILLETSHNSHAVLVWVVVALAYSCGYVSWRLVEKPFLKRKRQSIHPATVSSR
jgi:peptidoglycan/LPS O-acetylase OafA/YrhL